MVSRSLVLAYHGCDVSVARKVASGEERLRLSVNEYDIDAEHLALIRTAHKEYLHFCRVSNVPPAKNRGSDLQARYLDRAVFETLHQLRVQRNQPSFDTVRAFFVEGEPLYKGAGLRDLDHIQICVREPRKIIGYFLPRRG